MQTTPTELSLHDIETMIIAGLHRRSEGASVCPSDIARECGRQSGTAWRNWMDPVRNAAATLARQDRILITRKSATVSPEQLGGGPIRLRRGPKFGGKQTPKE